METAQTKQTQNPNTKLQRNYQIDVLKMVFTVMVFIDHTGCFTESFRTRDWSQISIDTTFAFFQHLGYVSVSAFFIISGFLMAKSLTKCNYLQDTPGKSSMSFVINKFKPMALPFWISSAMYLCTLLLYYVYVYISNAQSQDIQRVMGETAKSPFDLFLNVIPEFLVITNTGGLFYLNNNSATWYISAMLLAMIPLAYLFIKKKDFFVYVFSPVVSILSWGYLKQSYNVMEDIDAVFWGDKIIRAVSGLCFGVLAWTIYNKISVIEDRKPIRISLTITELILYTIFFYGIFTSADNLKIIFPTMLIFPIAIAITFSGKSYASELFKAKWLKCLAPVSLYIYLNHIIAINIIRALFSAKSYLFCTACAAALTAVMCVICYIGVIIVKSIIRKISTAKEV